MVAVLNSLIEIDEKGIPWISGANTKVVEVVLDKLAYGWSPEEMHRQHPHLSMAQIHAALSYYYEHKDEVDADIERRDRYVENLRAQQKNPLTRKELESILRHAGIDFVGPGGDAALQIDQVTSEACALQRFDRFGAAAAHLAVHDGLAVAI